ncbi:MAG: PIG-L family deacetylase [Thermoprotei archaeon]|nr:MAG: PIG-L family deacetylase [Thermoprotei archaeon]
MCVRIAVLGAHPDDPDSGTGGLIALLTKLGHEVTAVSFTRGELTGKMSTIEENAKVNEQEAVEAYKILGAKVVFLDFKDAEVYASREAVLEVKNTIKDLSPDIVITHWPIDTHSDHRAVGVVTISVIRSLSPQPALYFYEVMTGHQTKCFTPEIYIDVTEVAELKRKACYMHKNCFPEKWYPVHEKMMIFRGMEMGVKYAEAYTSFEKSYAHELAQLLKALP